MSSLSSKVVALSFFAVAVASQACTLASPTEVTMVPATPDDDDDGETTKAAATTSSGGSSGPACSANPVKNPDLGKMTACGGGKGHCADKAKMNSDMQMFFGADTCTGGQVCVDDLFIKAAGGELKSCTGLGGKGRCAVWALNAPMVADERSTQLRDGKSTCEGEGEVCIPCVDVSNNDKDTGICHAQGLMDGECKGGDAPATTPTNTPATTAATCCKGKGKCMDGSGLGESADKLEKDSCEGDGMVCAPTSLVTNQATKCDAGIMRGGKGVCMGTCFNGMLDTFSFALSQENCDAEEVCVACMFAKNMAPEGVKVPGCDD